MLLLPAPEASLLEPASRMRSSTLCIPGVLPLLALPDDVLRRLMTSLGPECHALRQSNRSLRMLGSAGAQRLRMRSGGKSSSAGCATLADRAVRNRPPWVTCGYT